MEVKELVSCFLESATLADADRYSKRLRLDVSLEGITGEDDMITVLLEA